MFKSNNINFDNVKPNGKLFSSKQLLFKDKNDLIRNSEKEKTLNFSKKSNFFCIFTYYLFCIICLI